MSKTIQISPDSIAAPHDAIFRAFVAVSPLATPETYVGLYWECDQWLDSQGELMGFEDSQDAIAHGLMGIQDVTESVEFGVAA